MTLTIVISACGQTAHGPAQGRTAEAVSVLRREGYRPVPSLPLPDRSKHVIATLHFTFDTRYGQPVAYYEKDGLYVLVARGSTETPRVPGADWHRIGNTIIIGWQARAANHAQFRALVEALSR